MTGFQPEETVTVGAGPLTPEAVLAVARGGARIELAADSLAAIRHGREIVDALADDAEPHYGVSTGFGALATRHIPVELRTQLQRSLIRSHAAGSGPEVERRGRPGADAAATGHPGHRPHRRPRGDRAGLRGAAQRRDHAGRARVRQPGLLGRPRPAGPLRAGRSWARAWCATPTGSRGPAAEALGRGRHRACRAAREGGPGADQRHRRHARHAGAGDRRPARAAQGRRHHRVHERRRRCWAPMRVFAADLQALRPHPGQAAAAANMRALLADSAIMASHRGPECTRVQDAYSLRCAPQVAGAARDTRRPRRPGGRAASWPPPSTTR